jgi:predicted DCC family thiol-disulfide oxidoreductase YuxK
MAAGAEDEGATPHPAGPVLLFDGTCGLCNGTVRVVLRLDRRGRIRFAPLGGSFAAGVVDRHPELREVDSLVLVECPGEGAERVAVKSVAVLRLTGHLGGPWRALGVLKVLPRALLDWTYDVVARHRYTVFGRFDRRPPPPVDGRSRFLE